jgi:CHAD domain-containing protein
MEGNVENTLAAALDGRWKEYRLQFKTCRGEFSEEAVHDLRVAARRLSAVLDILRAIEPHPRLQKMRRFLKDQLDDLDDLRDVQVMLVETSEAQEHLPQLKPFQDYLLKQEKRLLHVARNQVQASKPSEWSGRIVKMRAALEKESYKPGFSVRLLETMDNAYLKVSQLSSKLDRTKPATIHRLRIAFKKFRYMTEVIQPILANYPESYFKRMHDLQSAMGDIHDVDIFLFTLAEFDESSLRHAHKNMSSFDPKPIQRYYKNRQSELVTAFFKKKRELKTFWRPAPGKTFPWEKKNEPLHHPSRNRRAGGDLGPGGRRQPASTDRQRPEENAQDRAGTQGTGSADRPDPDQPLPSSGSDSENPGEEIRSGKR